MSDWYYARGGQQSGPVTFEQLGEIARSGALDPIQDLVWTSTMKDWTPAGQVPGLYVGPANPAAPAADPANPYAAPQSAWIQPAPAAGSALSEIPPGSEPLDVGACVKRGFDLTTRHFGIILLVGLVYLGITFGLGIIQGLLDVAFSGGRGVARELGAAGVAAMDAGQLVIFCVSRIVTQVISIFLSLGVTRVGLNLVSGKEVTVGMLFGEGNKLLRALGATILFFLMLILGLMLFIVPGFYLALRYGQYMVAIVDRDMGVMDSLTYSSSLTTNNRLLLLLLWLLCMLVIVAGMLACGVGLIFAGPVVWLSSIVAYRWMQYGHRVTLDQPGTTTPLLAGS